MYTYILCEFEYGYSGQFYQEVLDGNVVRMTDLDGNTLDLNSENTIIAYGAFVINPTPEIPSWANN